MATIDIKYLAQPHDGTPGTSWDDFEERILSVAAGKTDDRGWSLATVCTVSIVSTISTISAINPHMQMSAARL